MKTKIVNWFEAPLNWKRLFIEGSIMCVLAVPISALLGWWMVVKFEKRLNLDGEGEEEKKVEKFKDRKYVTVK